MTWKLKSENDRASATGMAHSGNPVHWTSPTHQGHYLRGVGVNSSGGMDSRSLVGGKAHGGKFPGSGFSCVIWVIHLFLSAVKNETHNNFLVFCVVTIQLLSHVVLTNG